MFTRVDSQTDTRPIMLWTLVNHGREFMSKSYAMLIQGAAAILMFAGSPAIGATGDAPPRDGPKEPRGCMQGRRPEPFAPPGMPGLLGFGEERAPPYLQGIDLTEEQQDKVFSILHAAAPELREHMKAARKAHEALHELGQSAAYDSAKAASLAQSEASAQSQLLLLKTRTDHEIFMIHTSEQRERLTERRREHDSHGEPPP
jgi:periplasmic protein CpxP/Spy